jgi:hypothetical protein
VVLVDSSPTRCTEAEAEGYRVFHGNAIDERLLLQVQLESRKAALALLHSEGLNLIYAQRALEYGVPRVAIALQMDEVSVNAEMAHEAGARVLFGGEFDIELWDVRVRRGLTRVEARRFEPPEKARGVTLEVPKEMRNVILPLALLGRDLAPVDDRQRVGSGGEVAWLVLVEREADARAWFEEHHWTELEATEPAED